MDGGKGELLALSDWLAFLLLLNGAIDNVVVTIITVMVVVVTGGGGWSAFRYRYWAAYGWRRVRCNGPTDLLNSMYVKEINADNNSEGVTNKRKESGCWQANQFAPLIYPSEEYKTSTISEKRIDFFLRIVLGKWPKMMLLPPTRIVGCKILFFLWGLISASFRV